MSLTCPNYVMVGNRPAFTHFRTAVTSENFTWHVKHALCVDGSKTFRHMQLDFIADVELNLIHKFFKNSNVSKLVNQEEVCVRNSLYALLTGAVLLRVLSKFAQNLSSTPNHSRTPYLTATNFHGKLANVSLFPIFIFIKSFLA